MPLFEMRDVVYRKPTETDVRLLDGADLAIYEGEFVLMIGANGSGKSTSALCCPRLSPAPLVFPSARTGARGDHAKLPPSASSRVEQTAPLLRKT